MDDYQKATNVKRSLSDYHISNVKEASATQLDKASPGHTFRLLLVCLVVFTAVWTIMAVIDYVFFYERSFAGIYITQLPVHALFSRFVVGSLATIITVLIAINTQTTETKDKALVQSSKWFSTTLKSMGVAVFAVNNDGKIIFINRVAQLLTGRKLEQSIGQPLTGICNLIQESTNEKVLTNQLPKVLQDNEQISFRTGHVIYNTKGDKCHVIGNLGPIRDDENKAVGAVMILHDISEIRRAESEILCLESAINFTDEVIFISGADGKTKYVNSSFEKVTGFQNHEIIGKGIEGLKSRKLDDSFILRINEDLTDDEAVRARCRITTKDGCEKVMESVTSRITDESGELVGFVSVNRDITRELKLHQQIHQLKKMEAVGRMASVISHDFNNILHAINGCNNLIRKKIDDKEKVLKFSDDIGLAIENGKGIIGQLLAFGRGSRSKVILLNPNDLISDFERILKQLISKENKLTIKAAPNLPSIRVDPIQLQQCITNLVVNAADSMPSGEIIIETRLVEVSKPVGDLGWPLTPGPHLVIAVTDSGPGIEKKILPNIYDPFYSYKKESTGTGLGLSVVYGFIKNIGGDIRIDTEIGKGTTFKLYIPAVERVCADA